MVCCIWVEEWRVRGRLSVLGLLFLADVELLGGGLALGEGVTACVLAALPSQVPD